MSKTGIGARLGQARRLLGVALHRDMTQTEVAAMIGKNKGTWSRWESEEDPPSEANLQVFVDLCKAHGLEGVTMAWLRYNEGQGPPVIGSLPMTQRRLTRKVRKAKPAPKSDDIARRKRG